MQQTKRKASMVILSPIPIGKKVKSASLFSMSLTILSRPLAKNVPELVLTLNAKNEEW